MSAADRRTERIRERAEQDRLSRDARTEREARARQHAIEQEHAKLALRQEKNAAKRKARDERNSRRKATRDQISARIKTLTPTVGRRAMIAGPILAPMTVAWIGQISFATETLGWLFVGAVIFAAAWEMTTAFTGWMYHQARKDGDRGTLFRVATWIFAASAGAMNYWHACPVITERLNAQTIRQHINLSPTPKAVSYGAMSLVGIALWELYSSLIHRKHLRAAGIVSSARPRFGILRWVRFPRITWHAWSLAVRYGIKTVDQAWSAAVVEIERRKLAKDKRPAVRVTVMRVMTRTVPVQKERMKLFWVEDLSALTLGPASGSGTGLPGGSQMGPGPGSGTQTSTGSGTQVREDNGTRSEKRSGTCSSDGSKTGPKSRSRTRSKTGPKAKVSDRLAEATAADKAYLADNGRHIPAEKLAKALGIGKPAALDLVKQVRGGHIDVAK